MSIRRAGSQRKDLKAEDKTNQKLQFLCLRVQIRQLGAQQQVRGKASAAAAR